MVVIVQIPAGLEAEFQTGALILCLLECEEIGRASCRERV